MAAAQESPGAAAIKNLVAGTVRTLGPPQIELTVAGSGNVCKDSWYVVALAVLMVTEYPFDTVKVRLQSMPWKYTGDRGCMKRHADARRSRTVLQAVVHRARFLWVLQGTVRHLATALTQQGLTSPLIGCAIETALMFSSYGEARRWLEPYGTAISVAGGGTARAPDEPPERIKAPSLDFSLR